jgi:uncharacterized integral membrane protein
MAEPELSMWQRVRSRLRRLSLGLILSVLVVLLLQNWAELEFYVFLTTVKMPGSLMLLAFAGAGFLAGALWCWSRR